MLQIFLIALTLALDAGAVSVSIGLTNPQGGLPQALRLGLWFGGFQFAMPLLGYALGAALSGCLSQAAPWVAFAILSFLGGRMLWEGFQPQPRREDFSCLTPRRLLLLALATSMDALAVGVSAACMGLDLFLSAAVIGLTAFALSALGSFWSGGLSRKLTERQSKHPGRGCHTGAQLLGGATLLAIAVKFLLGSIAQ